MNPAPDRAAVAHDRCSASTFALAIGIAVGFITTFTHHALPPWGLVAGLAIVVALVVGFRLVFDSRVIAAAAAVGVVGATGLLTLPGAGGVGLRRSTDPIGYVWAIAPTVLSVIVLDLAERRAASGGRREPI